MGSAVSRVANFVKSTWNEIKYVAHYYMQRIIYAAKSVGEGFMNSTKNIIKGCKFYIGGVAKIVKEVITLVASEVINSVTRNFHLFSDQSKYILSIFITAIMKLFRENKNNKNKKDNHNHNDNHCDNNQSYYI